MSRAKSDADTDKELDPSASARAPETGDGASDAEDEAIDLRDLEQYGVDGIVADLSEGDGDRRRPIWISILVLALSLPLLVRMYPDFRYWLQPSTPEDLGTAAAFVEGGKVPAGYRERFVKLRGTPDVRNVAVGKSRQETVRYMRLMESQGQLFAVVRTPIEQENHGETVRYPGEFEGRMTRLGDLGQTSWVLWSEPDQYKWLSRFYEIENISRTVDSTPAGLLSALKQGATQRLALETEDGWTALGDLDRIRLVIEHPEVRVLVGTESLDADAARAALESLGVPFVTVESREPSRHRFIVRVPLGDRDRVREALESRIEGPVDSANPREGVAVLPLTSTFVVEPDALTLEGTALTFPRGENISTIGYDVVDGALRERGKEDAMLRFEASQLRAVRIEQAIRLDPDGYVLLHGQTPSDQRMFGLLWVFTALVAMANAVAVAMSFRKRRRAGV